MKIIISEKQKKIITKYESNEGIFDPISKVYQGLKGVWRGEGYDYYRHLSELGNITRDLKKFDEPNRKIMVKLSDLKLKISNSKMPQDKKDLIMQHIDGAMSSFNTYDTYVDKISRAITKKFK